MSTRPKIIGITGGISSGKSTVARMLASLGAEIIDADEICHRLIQAKEVKEKIIKRFGITIQDNYGKIDRSRLSEIVFQDKTCLDDLCNILHPIVIEQIRSRITEIEKRGRRKAMVIDAALLEESDLSLICDFIVFVNTGKDHRVSRSKICRHWQDDELERRERFQMTLEDKRKKADYVVDNNFTEDNTFRQIREFWQLYIENN
ncbi:MAG: dephospho-CoA kinase [Candidatus Brocadia sinica]|uniref:Dephospho-CoA kinase n=1 Tax=Candidatus Brocadia sinica JPN1 TaxID=1197129 RepID=A0ABQ0JYV6_9BACT|nr:MULTISPECIES: dephospho-CoA kinase [Brocadia]KXK25000.1 MAG: dephospho-CoA kinase [Candidatus Brocadia sinica]NOG40294.1 dephospho-CoA kinase [Planctomycetota bacterium]MCK6469354.1 dephospho-CoA kinase [Candidatus Brocadia sinica]NUO04002.1 dephospho-CoA kinase [Candidatus Brocadia sinica]GAN33871.1 dephospho-CoA kinase [Candidatus Brocadia sinica JPN1]